jgi:hypothetical protein
LKHPETGLDGGSGHNEMHIGDENGCGFDCAPCPDSGFDPALAPVVEME